MPGSEGSGGPGDGSDPLVQARQALAALAEDFRRRYGAVIFEVDARSAGSGIVLGGRVLLPSQRAAALEAVRSRLAVPVDSAIVALTEQEDAGAWLRVAAGIIDIKSQPGGELSTQALAGDPPLRRLGSRDGWWLLELADGTLGWAEPGGLAPASGEAPPDLAAWRAAWRGEPRPATEAAWRRALAPWWGAPYLWGGCSPAGVDCSGLSQRLYKQVMDLGLPKHSGDQLRQGTRVAMGELRTGDLVGLRHLERRIGHVAVVLSAGPLQVAHASLERGVTEERLDELLRRYQARGARRFA